MTQPLDQPQRPPSPHERQFEVSPLSRREAPAARATQEEDRIEIKGTRRGLSVTLGSGDWPELLRELDDRLGKGSAFFQGSGVNLHAGRRELSEQQLQELMNILTKHNIELASLDTNSSVAAGAARSLGIRLALPEVSYAPPGTPRDEWSEGMLVRRTVRSGQSIQHPGHVVIIGDVNPGAEIVAGGDVVVWGKLRGMVQAGAVGNDEAVVCALELKPTLLRIGAYFATSPDEESSKTTQPEVASVIDGQIVAQPWTSR